MGRLGLGKTLAPSFAAGMEEAEYRKMADVEDGMWYYRALHGHILDRLMNAAGQVEGPLLDAGCGTGGLLRRLHEKHPELELTGVDLSPLACELARERTTAHIVEASLTDLPLDDATFATVVSADVLYHIEDDATALRELYRVLKSGGRLVVNVPAYPWLWSYHDKAVHAQRRYGRRELTCKLRDAGFLVTELTHWNMLLLPLVVARRKLWPAPASGSDVRAYARWSNRLLNLVMRCERWVLRTCGALPAGR